MKDIFKTNARDRVILELIYTMLMSAYQQKNEPINNSTVWLLYDYVLRLIGASIN